MNNSTLKTGINTTEFWLSLLTVVLTTVGPYFIDTPTVAKVIGIFIAVLTTLGYTASRTVLKNTQINTNAGLVALPPLPQIQPGDVITPTTSKVTPIQVNTPLHPDVTPPGSVPGV